MMHACPRSPVPWWCRSVAVFASTPEHAACSTKRSTCTTVGRRLKFRRTQCWGRSRCWSRCWSRRQLQLQCRHPRWPQFHCRGRRHELFEHGVSQHARDSRRCAAIPKQRCDARSAFRRAAVTATDPRQTWQRPAGAAVTTTECSVFKEGSEGDGGLEQPDTLMQWHLSGTYDTLQMSRFSSCRDLERCAPSVPALGHTENGCHLEFIARATHSLKVGEKGDG